MVLLTVTSSILRSIRACCDLYEENDFDAASTGPSLDSPRVGDPISHSQIIALSSTLRKKKYLPPDIPIHLEELLRGSRVYHEAPRPKAEPTSEYKTLMARLHREEEAREYERMINPPLPMETFQQRFPNSSGAKLFSLSTADIGEDDETTYADINRQMALIINVLVSIVACSVAIWLAAKHWSTPSRLGLSMGGSGLVGVAEIVVYAGYIRRLKEAQKKGKEQIEIKEIIKTWVIGGEEQDKTMFTIGTLEQPPSTGMRRRTTRSE